MSVEEDIQELRDSLAALRAENNTLKMRLSDVEEFAETHIGADWGQSMINQNSPHPNMSSDSIEVGGGAMFLANSGIYLPRKLGTYPIEVLGANFGNVRPGRLDMDFNNDGVIDILELSRAASNFPARGSSIIWAENNDLASGDVVQGGSTPSTQSYITGVVIHDAAGPVSEFADLRIASTGSTRGAEVVTHISKTGSNDQADITFTGAIVQPHDEPAQITADKNNYDLGTNYQSVVYINSDAARNITGIVAPPGSQALAKYSWWLILVNSGSFNITLKDSSASSTLGNRFSLDADIVLKPDQGCFLLYDNTSTSWRALSAPSAGGTVATDAIWDAKGDLAVGTGADTAQKLTVGTDGTRLGPSSGFGGATGLKWMSIFYNINSPSGSGTTPLSSADKFVLQGTCTAAKTITLYSAATIGAGDCVIVKRSGTDGNTVTINTTSSQTIDGALSITIAPLESVTLVSDGSNWWRC